jgi:tetratricopeptide (TPR) repeat protein
MNAANLLASARVQASQGNWAKAAGLARQASILEPDNADSSLLLGVALHRSGDDESAMYCFEGVLNRDPRSFDALNLVAIHCQRRGDFARTVECSRRALEVRPGDFGAAFNLGLGLALLGRLDEANHWLELAASSGQPPHIAALANLLWDLGRQAEAIAALQKSVNALQIEKNVVRLMEMHLDMGQPSAAIQAGKLTLGSPRVQLKLARAYANLGDRGASAAHLNRALQIGPNVAEVHLDKGFRQQDDGLFEAAEKSFRKAIELEPQNAIAFFGIVHSRKIVEEDRPLIEAMKTLEADPRTSPNDRAHLLYALGKSFDNLQDFETAIQFFDQGNALYGQIALKGRPFNPARVRQEVDETIQTYTPEFFGSHPGNPSDLPIFVLGMMRSGTTMLEQILSRHPDIGGAGEVHFWSEHKDPEEYVALLARLVPNQPRVVDKNPANVMAAGQIHASLPNAKIVHIVRDPADTALSIWTTHVTRPPEFCCDRENIAAMYRQYSRLAEHWRAIMPADRYLEVRYEDVVTSPETTIKKILEFLELEWSDQCLHPEKGAATVQTPSNWQVRQPLNPYSIGRWRKYERWIPEFVALRSVINE